MDSSDLGPPKYCAWNPGLESQLPREYLPLSTIFRAENVSTTVAKAYELSNFCGLPANELVGFRVDRLIVHELLVHVTTGIAVPDGRDYEDLGKNFREIASTILNRFIAPHREDLARTFEQLKHSARVFFIERELLNAFDTQNMPVQVSRPGFSRWLFAFGKRPPQPSQPLETVVQRDQRIISEWRQKANKMDDRVEAACFAALHRIATAIIGQRGRLLGDKELLKELAVTLLCNDLGSEVIGSAILPFVQEAIASETDLILSPFTQKGVTFDFSKQHFGPDGACANHAMNSEVVRARSCLYSRHDHNWWITNLGQFAAIKFRRPLLVVHCYPPKLGRDLWAGGEPRGVCARCGKIDKFLIGPHKPKNRQPTGTLIVRLTVLSWRGMRRADARPSCCRTETGKVGAAATGCLPSCRRATDGRRTDAPTAFRIARSADFLS